MQHHQDWSIQVLKDPIFQQIAPLVVFFVIPLIVYLSAAQFNFDRAIYTINKILAMVLDRLGISLPWLWGAPQKPSSSSSRIRKHRRKSSSAKVVQTRAEQIALQEASKEPISGEWMFLSVSIPNPKVFQAKTLRIQDLISMIFNTTPDSSISRELIAS